MVGLLDRRGLFLFRCLLPGFNNWLVRLTPLLHLVGAIWLAQVAAVEHAFSLMIHIGHAVDDPVRILAKYDVYLFFLQGLDQLR